MTCLVKDDTGHWLGISIRLKKHESEGRQLLEY